ncbi:MAG: ABC transporter permease [Thermoplasmata archaeon]
MPEDLVAIHRKKELRMKAKYTTIGSFAVVVFVAIWQFLTSSDLGLYYLPKPESVAKAFSWAIFNKDILGYTMFEHLQASLIRVLYGSIIAILFAVPVGLIIGYSKYAEASTTPFVEFFRTIPPLAWLPIAIALFHDIWESVFIVFLGVFFPVLLSTISGVKDVDKTLLDVARTLGAGKIAIFTKVIFPYSVPYIMTGIRVGLGIGWMTIVAAEMLGVQGGGVGICLWTYSSIGRMDIVFAYMLLIGIVGFSMIKTFEFVEKRLAKFWGFSR